MHEMKTNCPVCQKPMMWTLIKKYNALYEHYFMCADVDCTMEEVLYRLRREELARLAQESVNQPPHKEPDPLE